MLLNSPEPMGMRRGLSSLARSMLDRLPREDSRRPLKQTSVEGYCEACREVTVNQEILVGRFMKGRRCEDCGRVYRAGPLAMAECYSNELMDRLGERIKHLKPAKLRALKGHVHEIPSRVVGKVLREAGYVSDLFLEEEEWPKDG